MDKYKNISINYLNYAANAMGFRSKLSINRLNSAENLFYAIQLLKKLRDVLSNPVKILQIAGCITQFVKSFYLLFYCNHKKSRKNE